MLDIFIVAKQNGQTVPFLASSLHEARSRAVELGGRRYRYITLINPTSRKYQECKNALDI